MLAFRTVTYCTENEETPNQASFKVYRVKHASQADLKIFKVSTPEQAGWRTKDHLLVGKLG